MTETAAPEDATGPGRVARWRTRAEDASVRYRKRAQEQPLLGLPLAFFAQYTARQGVLLASAAAFRLFLWLVPLALLGAGLLAAVAPDHQKSLESASKSAGLTGAASQQVVTALKDGHRSWVIAVITGAVVFLWATRTLMRNLTIANAHAWRAPIPRPSQRHVLVTSLLFAGTWLLVFAFTAGLHRASRLIAGGSVVALLVEGCLMSGAWFFIIRRLPDRRRSWHDLIPGSLLFGFGFSFLNVAGRLYLPHRFAHSSAVYGSLGIASVMLVWMLLIGQLIVSAAIVNSVWRDYRADRSAGPQP